MLYICYSFIVIVIFYSLYAQVPRKLFVRLLCEININNMNIIKIMNCVPPKIKPYCLNV